MLCKLDKNWWASVTRKSEVSSCKSSCDNSCYIVLLINWEGVGGSLENNNKKARVNINLLWEIKVMFEVDEMSIG